jgi:hypothetical protein
MQVLLLYCALLGSAEAADSCAGQVIVERYKLTKPTLANSAKRELLVLCLRAGMDPISAERLFGDVWVKWRAGPTVWWYYELDVIVRLRPRLFPTPLTPDRIHGGIY